KLKEENAGDVQTEESPEFVAANDELKVAEDSGDVKAIATAKLKVEAISKTAEPENPKIKALSEFEAEVKTNMNIK
ncbi:MAG: hypothetical protein ACUZ8E_07320, partial [Candidatus Anammoxibacter sp.]